MHPKRIPSLLLSPVPDRKAEGGLYFPTNMKNEIIWADVAFYNIIDNVEGLYEQSENVVVAFVTGYEAYLDGNMPFVLSKATVQ